jgi:hypothetical protein
MEILETIGAWGGYVAVALILIFRKSAQKYVDKKAENLATIEDTAKITQEVESIKSQHLRQSHAWKWIFEKEYLVLEQVWRASWEIQNSARAVRPNFDSVPADPDEAKKEYKERSVKYSEAVELFLNIIIKQRPFIPPSIYETCEQIQDSVIKLKNEFEKTFRGVDERIEWKTIREQGVKLEDLMAQLNNSIRQHIHEFPNQNIDPTRKTPVESGND